MRLGKAAATRVEQVARAAKQLDFGAGLPHILDLGFMRADPDLHVLKTHEPTPALIGSGDKVIYAVRDGRDALTSYFHYQRAFDESSPLLRDMILGRVQFGAWSEHVRNWIGWSPRCPTLLLRYRDLLAARDLQIEAIARFLRREIRDTVLPDFATLHREAPDFFRKGKTGTWRELFTPDEHALFWSVSGDMMDLFKFSEDRPPMAPPAANFAQMG